ncbi:DnaJ domain-containing protein [Radiomyces spectabilis]|uniref:DnaJ domain-containing protein n=1 Tax=Radiomyces spectabilis TaxID=64574 RepID=UPI00221FED95|nr:DnaJ domain-containing protein [Radiomyces spectabilis]KAI8384327.1 DnaJ domain-containing protein [Radiomyces spectabilis]
MTNLPDYYSILDIPETATQEDIRQAYKKQALLHHPDRLPDTATAAERAEQTRQFQLIADAYYILSDSTRREAFDRNRAQHRTFASSSTAEPTTSTNYAHHMFGNVFEELLRPEVEHPSHLWRILGAGAGAILGFIIGNVGGLAVVSSRTGFFP